jgi:hypothetical protein
MDCARSPNARSSKLGNTIINHYGDELLKVFDVLGTPE